MTRYGRVVPALLLVSFASCGPSSDSRPEEEVQQQQQPVWNGTDYQPTPGNTAKTVHILSGPFDEGTNSFTVKNSGSGVALNNRWVLTAGHVRGPYKEDGVRAELHGSSQQYKAITAAPVEPSAQTSGPTSGPFPWQHAGRKYDLELIRFEQMWTTDIKTPIFHRDTTSSKTTTEQIIDMGEVECWGWGKGGSSGNAGILRHAILPVQGGTHTGTFKYPYPHTYTFSPPANFFTTPTTSPAYPVAEQQVADGDSGGPCYQKDNYHLVGIIRNNESHPTDPSPLGVIASVGAYDAGANWNLDKQLELIAQGNPEFVAFHDVDGDENPDLVMVTNNGGYFDIQMQLTNAPLLALSEGFVGFSDPTFGLLMNPPLAANIESALVTIGDFDNNGAGDVLAMYGGQAFYFDGRIGSLPEIHWDQTWACAQNLLDCQKFEPVATDYERIRVSDLNNDGFDDLEGFVEGKSAPDVYYGSEHGLTTPTHTRGFPTSDGEDGKLLVLAPPASPRVGIPDYTFELATYHDESAEPDVSKHRFHVEVFDGDMSLSHDRTWLPEGGNSQGARTCFLLYPDRDQDGTGMTHDPIVVQEDDHFENNAWASLFDDPTRLEDQDARLPDVDGWVAYNYLLRVFLTTGSCSEPPVYPTVGDVANGLKLRVSGNIFFWSSGGAETGLVGGVTIVGSDSVGPFATKDQSSVPIPYLGLYEINTDYDGNWTFNIATSLSLPDEPYLETISDFWVSEADADSLLNPQSPQDPHAIAANEEINFSIQDDSGYVFYQPEFPSGQYAPLAPCVRHHVASTPPEHPFASEDVYWVWSSVMSRNYIWLGAPTADPPNMCADPISGQAATASVYDPSSLVPVLRMSGERPTFLVPTTSAEPISHWLSDDGRQQISTLLPITLGQEHHGGHGNGGHGSCDQAKPGRGGAMRVQQFQQAMRILRQHDQHPHPLSWPGLLRSLEAQLLTAKLNLARAATRGEDISRGYLYGRTSRVSDVIERADETLSKGRRDKPCTSKDEIAEVIVLLKAINSSNITYRAPASGALSAMTLRTLIGSNSATELWFRH